MPATEQTWRDTKQLHRIFMASGVALLLSTIWMFYADHNRGWKRYQDTARTIDLATNRWSELQHRTEAKLTEHSQLAEALLKEQQSAFDSTLLQEFASALNNESAANQIVSLNQELTNLSSSATDGVSNKATSLRNALRNKIDTALNKVKFDEKSALDIRKSKSALLDAARANLDIGVRDSVSQEALKSLQDRVDVIKTELDQLTTDYQTKADKRKNLDRILKQLTLKEAEAKKAVDTNQAELVGLRDAYGERQMTYFTDSFPWLGKKWLAWPILDAFNSPRKIDNLWNDDLSIDYNFRKVRRFDRCTTCHQSIEKSLPGQADKAAFVKEESLTFLLQTPTSRPDLSGNVTAKSQASLEDALQTAYGFRIASTGLLNANDTVVTLVFPQSPASRAELQTDSESALQETGNQIRSTLLNSSNVLNSMDADSVDSFPKRPGLSLGDVIVQIGDDVLKSPDEAYRILLRSVSFGQPVKIKVKRGLPSPYTSHPRLDLFVGSLSPHKASTFACTVCHEGQGSATAFEWASHTPNDPRQRKEWMAEHHWFDNAHWIYPMYAKRFAEASCIKCHHNVVELEPSERFPDPPAPKVTHGYHLILKYGCYGCHEITGFDGPNRRVGPDLRLEPNYFASALEIRYHLEKKKADGSTYFDSLNEKDRNAIQELVSHPENDALRNQLLASINSDEKLPVEAQKYTPNVHKLASTLKDIETPGDIRKPGPSLRHIASKLDDAFLVDWIRIPKSFRETSRMPQFFGLWNHLDGKAKEIAQQYEPIEILGISSYLKSRSQKFEQLERPENISKSAPEEQVSRGKVAFEERGCLACHNHKDFPGTDSLRRNNEIVQGPDLSAIGSKFDATRNPAGKDWLYSWIKQPSRYHTRTVMPDLFLDVIQKKDNDGKVVSQTDPVADIVAYLLTSKSDWTPSQKNTIKLDDSSRAVLNQMVLENLKDSYFESTAKKYSEKGIPPELERELKGAEKELLSASGQLTDEQKLLYIGNKTINKYGCFGCHDIPGFEDAKPIGTALADWGRKDPAKLAFEHITHYLHGHGNHSDAESKHNDTGESSHDSEVHERIPEFYEEQLAAGNRIGFIYQKLAEPRSYDYKKTENKKYSDRLRMPQFPFSVEEREAVITFVLGLVADPPADKYVFRPNEKSKAIIAGRKALDKYNCGGCHLLEAENWKLSFPSGSFGDQPETKIFPFLRPEATSEAVASSLKLDHRGLLQGSLHGMPSLRDEDGRAVINDSEGDPIEDNGTYVSKTLNFAFDLWSPVILEGKKFQVGVVPLNVNSSQIEKRYASRGGVLSKYLVPRVLQREKASNQAAKGSEAWAWVPPPLIGEGKKVQSQWLHDFLLNPHPIRPASVLRMPRFNMTSREANDLAKYFAVLDDAAYPYESTAHRELSHLTKADAEYRSQSGGNRLDAAMQIVTNNNFCIKCHIVGDFEPKGADRAKAPNLARIYERLRPGYLREWIANPKQILPYTSMPINIPYNPDDGKFLGGVNQDLYHGTSIEQVDALVDLLMNYDTYSSRKNLVTPLIKLDQPAAQPSSDGSSSSGSKSGT